jgi:glycosyltransferase involved in cell wall biosynthesis
MSPSAPTDRPPVLVFVDYYLPGFRNGGPVQSVRGVVEGLGDDFDFHVLTRDRDVGQRAPYPGMRRGVWSRVGKGVVRYLDRAEVIFGMRRAINSAPQATWYFNSLFSPWFSIVPLLLRRLGLVRKAPVVLAPRGELASAALALHPRRKRVFLAVAKSLRLHDGVMWQATSDAERSRIEDVIGDDATVVRADVVTAPLDFAQPASRVEKMSGRARLVFLSRVSPMKNLDFALRVLAEVTGDVSLDIYGPIEDQSYWKACQRSITRLPPTARVAYRGEVSHDRVGSILTQYDLMLLPSLGENHGHVVLEALAAGCPVALSEHTPWGGVAEAGAGCVLPLNEEAWRASIQAVLDDAEEAADSRALRAQAYARRVFLERHSGDAVRDLFLRPGLT